MAVRRGVVLEVEVDRVGLWSHVGRLSHPLVPQDFISPILWIVDLDLALTVTPLDSSFDDLGSHTYHRSPKLR